MKLQKIDEKTEENANGKIFCVDRLKELVLLKWHFLKLHINNKMINATCITISMTKLEKNLKLKWSYQWFNYQNSSGKEKRSMRLSYVNRWQDAVIKIAQCCCKGRHTFKQNWNTENNPVTNGETIFNKGTWDTRWRKSSSKNDAPKT